MGPSWGPWGVGWGVGLGGGGGVGGCGVGVGGGGVGVGVWGGVFIGVGGWGAPISRSGKMASREFGGVADIAGACERVGGYARSVMNPPTLGRAC